jgi:hypothetical protein
MEAIEHSRAHSEHVITGLTIRQLPLYPFLTSHSWLPIRTPSQMFVNMVGILIHTVYESVIIIVYKIRDKLLKTIILEVMTMSAWY